MFTQLLFFVLISASTLNAKCGTERWSVKTATDPDASKIKLSEVAATVQSMRALGKPASLPANNRIFPTETTVFRINATLTSYKAESDSDYHLVLSSGGVTMIAEIPSPDCISGSRFTSQISSARAAFDRKFHVTTKYQDTNTRVSVLGVGFFDFVHGQKGVAPNGIELHPVLAISFL